MHLDTLTQEQQIETPETADENCDTITVVDRNGNTDSIKIEQIENINMNTNNENETTR